MLTRDDFLNNRCSFGDYYLQFVTEWMVALVGRTFGGALARSADEHFNDIPLKLWDDLCPAVVDHVRRVARAVGDTAGGGCSGNCVCALKRAARVYVEQGSQSTERAEEATHAAGWLS